MYVATFKQISYKIDFKNVLKDFSFKIENILILTLLSASSQNGQTHSKQFVGNSVLGKSVFDHFVGLALKGLIKDSRLLYTPQHQKSSKSKFFHILRTIFNLLYLVSKCTAKLCIQTSEIQMHHEIMGF